ncbi:E3 ubiquitin-protein ligase Herc [Acrasis kona]
MKSCVCYSRELISMFGLINHSKNRTNNFKQSEGVMFCLREQPVNSEVASQENNTMNLHGHKILKSNSLFVCGSSSNLGYFSGCDLKEQEHGSDDAEQSKDDLLTPVQYPKNHVFRTNCEIVSVACGASHTVFLTDDGRLFACGGNEYRQCGFEKRSNVLCELDEIDYFAINNIRVVDIVSKGFHTLFATDDGKVYSCGRNNWGQLGIKTKSRYEQNIQLVCSDDGFENKKVVKMSSGYGHSAFLTEEGKVYSTGANEFGQLGLGHYEHEDQPRLMNFGDQSEPIISEVYSGYAFTMLLSNEGQVYAVGSNSGGQLAIGIDVKKIHTPTMVVISALTNKVVTHVSCGQFHTVFVTSDNEVYMSGRSVTTEDNLAPRVFAPERIKSFYNQNGKHFEHIPPISFASCGRRYTTFMTPDHDVYVMGRNLNGQLGYGGLNNCPEPRLIHFEQLKSVNKHTHSVQVACGANFCAYYTLLKKKFHLISHHFCRMDVILRRMELDKECYSDIMITTQNVQ